MHYICIKHPVKCRIADYPKGWLPAKKLNGLVFYDGFYPVHKNRKAYSRI